MDIRLNMKLFLLGIFVPDFFEIKIVCPHFVSWRSSEEYWPNCKAFIVKVVEKILRARKRLHQKSFKGFILAALFHVNFTQSKTKSSSLWVDVSNHLTGNVCTIFYFFTVQITLLNIYYCRWVSGKLWSYIDPAGSSSSSGTQRREKTWKWNERNVLITENILFRSVQMFFHNILNIISYCCWSSFVISH